MTPHQGGYCSCLILTATPLTWTLEGLFVLTQPHSRPLILSSCIASRNEEVRTSSGVSRWVQRYPDSIAKQLAQTLIVCL